MKMLRKYATMAILLVSVATIMPMDRNIVDNKADNKKEIVIELKKTENAWYCNPIESFASWYNNPKNGLKVVAAGLVIVTYLMLAPAEYGGMSSNKRR